MSKLITVSPSPHVHTNDSVNKIMYGVLIALIPAFIVSIYVFGIDALFITLVAVLSCLFFEYAIQKFLLKKKELSILDGSAAITGVLLAFNVPSSLPVWIMIVGSLVAIGIGKMSFGGIGNNPFNPALVGRVFLLMSFPVDMTLWPLPNALQSVDAISGATPLGFVKEGLAKGDTIPELMQQLPNFGHMFLGTMGGSLGEVSAAALILGGLYMLYKKIITWHIPVAVIASMFIFSDILHITDPNMYASPVFHLLAGGTMLGAIFMATDMVSSPMSKKGMLLYGVIIGILTIAIRTFGAYPEGMSFAILIMNAFVPLINKYMKPTRFGHNTKKK